MLMQVQTDPKQLPDANADSKRFVWEMVWTQSTPFSSSGLFKVSGLWFEFIWMYKWTTERKEEKKTAEKQNQGWTGHEDDGVL